MDQWSSCADDQGRQKLQATKFAGNVAKVEKCGGPCTSLLYRTILGLGNAPYWEVSQARASSKECAQCPLYSTRQSFPQLCVFTGDISSSWHSYYSIQQNDGFLASRTAFHARYVEETVPRKYRCSPVDAENNDKCSNDNEGNM